MAATTAGGGFISGNTAGSYAQGSVVNLIAQPASGWQFLGWQGDATGTPRAAGNFTNDVLIPGIPGNGAIVDANKNNVAMEILTYIQFPAAGSYKITFNSADGFRTYVGDRAVDVLNSPIISEADVARGASDTAQWVYVAQAGAYPDFPVFRLSNRRGYTSSRPRKSARNSAIFASGEDI